MKERKELNPFDDGDGVLVYPKTSVDAVMDAYEARIKELETDFHELSIDFSLSNERIKELEVANTNLLDANVKLVNRIKELESIPHTDNSAVISTLQERIKELEASQPKWISVKDRLPNECEPVLGYNAENNEYVVVWMEDVNGTSEWSDGNFNWTIDSFTHWMPLPEQPKESKDA